MVGPERITIYPTTPPDTPPSLPNKAITGGKPEDTPRITHSRCGGHNAMRWLTARCGSLNPHPLDEITTFKHTFIHIFATRLVHCRLTHRLFNKSVVNKPSYSCKTSQVIHVHARICHHCIIVTPSSHWVVMALAKTWRWRIITTWICERKAKSRGGITSLSFCFSFS